MLESLKKFNIEKNIVDKAILEELRRNLIISNEISDGDKEDKGLLQIKEIFDRKAKMILALFDGEFEENEDRVRTPLKKLSNQDDTEQAIYVKVANSALTKRINQSFERVLRNFPVSSIKTTVAEERKMFITDFVNLNKELSLKKSKGNQERAE